MLRRLTVALEVGHMWSPDLVLLASAQLHDVAHSTHVLEGRNHGDNFADVANQMARSRVCLKFVIDIMRADRQLGAAPMIRFSSLDESAVAECDYKLASVAVSRVKRGIGDITDFPCKLRDQRIG